MADTYTNIAEPNPANADGSIDYMCLYLKDSYGGNNVDIASFEKTNGNDFKTNGYAEGLSSSDGKNEWNAPGDFTAFNINTGEYIGFYGVVKVSIGAGTNFWNKYGDQIPSNSQTYDVLTNYDASIYATGAEAAAARRIFITHQ